MPKLFKRFFAVAWGWVLDKIIEHWPVLLTTVIGGGGMSYFAYLTDFLRPYAPFSWGSVGLLSMLIISACYLLYASAKEKSAISNYTDKKSSVIGANVLAPTHQDERIDLMIFYHPYFKLTENVRFENCELMGPAYIHLDGCTLSTCTLNDCEIVIVRPDRPVKGVIAFKHCVFFRCYFYRVTWLMNYDNYKALPPEIRSATTIISDGRIGDV